MKVLAIVQARTGSTRLPKKVLKPIGNISMIEVLLKRLMKSNEIDEYVIATTQKKEDKVLEDIALKLGCYFFSGDENDVLLRYYKAAKKYSSDIVVRVTGDCPLIDSSIVDHCIKTFKENSFDYVSNINPPTFPDGLDVEVFSIKALEEAQQLAITKFDREHVTPFIRNSSKFSKKAIRNKVNLSALRWTVDEPEDLLTIRKIFNYFSPNIQFSWKDVLELREKEPLLFSHNEGIINNEGAIMNTGQKLYKRAKRVIPGGNMLLSKRPEMFLPNIWPSYFSKSKGCKVWDLDGNEYIDMSIMGIGTNILGYGNDEVDSAVMDTVRKGNMSTFNCPEEVYLAEKLIEIHPWADMARFARSGGEINSIAVRIARAFSGRDKIAICGYHGWHDWYISSNLSNDKNLDGHLLPGLQPNGVPRGLTGTALPFEYNNIEQLEKIINDNPNEIAAIKMEVVRNELPQNDFLLKVRKIATDNNIVLIFDECTSGFRETFGGIHKKFSVEPDLAIFGKALGNGYAISACIGTKAVMEATQKTFISSTFWTERIGPSAALKTLEIMERVQSWQTITSKGKKISHMWKELANLYDLKISTWGIDALCGFSFDSKNALEYKTLITQEMLKKGFLAGNSIYLCTEHRESYIDLYFKNLEEIFKIIQRCEDGLDVNSVLNGPVCHSGFKRLN